MSCQRCHRSTIAIELRPGGRSVVAHSCRPCEVTIWELEGSTAGLDRVLDLVAETRQSFMRRRASIG